MLTTRQRTLLNTIVEDFVNHGIPVGSKALMNSHHLSISSATIRSEMKRLEEAGLLEKPHHSSGRIPSVRGYQYYVHALQHDKDLERPIAATAIDQMADRLAAGTNYFSLVSGFLHHQLQHIQLIPVQDSVVVIMLFEDGTMVSDQVEAVFEPHIIHQLNSYFNQLIDQFNALDTKLMFTDDPITADQRLVTRLKAVIMQHMKDQPVVHASDKDYLFETLPDLNLIRTTLQLIDSGTIFTKLNNRKEHLINVTIGQEIDQTLKDVSLVTAPVETGRFNGQIIIIGPVHMSYRKVFNELNMLQGGTF